MENLKVKTESDPGPCYRCHQWPCACEQGPQMEKEMKKEPRDNPEWGKVPESSITKDEKKGIFRTLSVDEMELIKERNYWWKKAEEQADEVQRQNNFIKRANEQLFDLMKYTISQLVNR